MAFEDYGSIVKRYEVSGFNSLSPDRQAHFGRVLIKECLALQLAVGGSLEAGGVDLISDRSSGYPDVRLERENAAESRLVACDYVSTDRGCMKGLRAAIGKFPELALREVTSERLQEK